VGEKTATRARHGKDWVSNHAILEICRRSGAHGDDALGVSQVCDALQLSCDANDPMTEMIVMKIVELARAGELDPDRLCSRALLELDGPH
jgi:hypothetical protein